MTALKIPGWLHLPTRRRKAAPADDLAGMGAELGLDLSLACDPVAPPRTLWRRVEEMRALRRRQER